LPYLASDNAIVDSASTISLIYADSPLLAADSPLAPSASLNLVVYFSFYPLQQNTSFPPFSPASPPLISRHPMVLRPWQLKITNPVASAVTASFRVLHSPSSEPLALFDADRYAV